MYLIWRLIVVPIAAFCVLMVVPGLIVLAAVVAVGYFLLLFCLALVLEVQFRLTHRKDAL